MYSRALLWVFARREGKNHTGRWELRDMWNLSPFFLYYLCHILSCVLFSSTSSEVTFFKFNIKGDQWKQTSRVPPLSCPCRFSVKSKMGWSRLIGLPKSHDKLYEALATHTIHIGINS